MTPRDEPHQAVLDAGSRCGRRPRTHRYGDYWGTVVTAFDVHTPHERLAVTASATVETLPPGDRWPPASLGRPRASRTPSTAGTSCCCRPRAPPSTRS